MTQEPEWKTRRQRVNAKLRLLSPEWEIIKYHDRLDVSQLSCHAVEEYPTANGPADYALFVKAQLLGIIEAKRVSVNPQNVLEQAKRYSRGAFDGAGNWQGYRVPFLYVTNGELIYFVDVRDEKYISRKIANFHTADALEELFGRDLSAGYTWLQNTPISIEGLRDYQAEAIASAESAIAQGKRAMLIAMATGTGKTFTTVAQVYRLLESKAAKRILFLVDRRALAAQAVRAFASFNTPNGNKFNQEYELYSQRIRQEDLGEDISFDAAALDSVYLTSPQATHTYVFICTIQRIAIYLLGKERAAVLDSEGIDEESDAEHLPIPIHAFDVIIADECHRGYTAKETSAWRDTLSYFDAIKIGLTATPAPHSLSLFYEVIYRYTTEQAILDGYLVDYEAVKLRSEVRMKGVFLREGEMVGLVDTSTGAEVYDQLEDEREFSTTEIERQITAPDSNRKIIREIVKYANRHQQETGRFPKILIFAINDLAHTSHADQLVRICREEFGKGDDFVQKITGSKSVDRPLQKIREFRNRPNPKVVVTVDMLTTGVDIPSLEFVVFLRPVKSRILWIQMLGRGTRLCPEINKTHFKIFDCFDGTLIKYFDNTTDLKIEPPRKDPVPLEKLIENIDAGLERDYNLKLLLKRLRRVEHGMSGEARRQFADYIPDGDIGRFAGELPQRLQQDFVSTMNLLQDQGFQNLLLNYPKPPKSFLIGYEVEDTVSSRVMSPGGSYRTKKADRPEDYLDKFARFVRENPEQIEAIQILLERPRAWRTEVLNELRSQLASHKFSERELQKAHKQVHNKLADIISMVKHAARQEEPIYSSIERVDRALATVKAGKSFSVEQEKWLGYVREHLIQNLTLEPDDFDYAPIFESKGGLGKAKKVFAGGLDQLIRNINWAIAA